MEDRMSNPFAVQTPEAISADDVVFLFVNVFTEFYNILKPGHTFLHGPRGSGKSMMYRYMLPDCQRIERKAQLKDLEYFAVYVPIKSTDLHLAELARLENKHANLLLNEHLLTINVAAKTFASLASLVTDESEGDYGQSVRAFYAGAFSKLLRSAGWEKPLPAISDNEGVPSIFEKLTEACEDVHRIVLQYLRKVAFSETAVSYDGPICGYLDFLLPLLQQLRKLPLMPDGPIFLLVDDADNLNEPQTTILNTWVSYRSSSDVSFKVSTQLNYKTWRTLTKQTIDTPHDYSEVNISAVYTTSKDKYRERVYEIVKKRLEIAGIDVLPEEFFPPDMEQEAKIDKIKEEIVENYEKEGRGYRARDDVTRYARPNYIASLKGKSKSASTYSYSGFDQLVHISSGIIRHFLEAASLMYGEMQSRYPDKPVLFIEPTIQNKIVRQMADHFLFSEFEKLEADEANENVPLDKVKKLRNLVEALGRTFEQILISDASERRIFSIAFSDPPDDEILGVLKLGLRYGYFHESTIGTKDGTGRTRLYILSRRLAPHFTLDPTSFAGYKFVTTRAIHDAMRNPNSLVGKVKSRGVDDVFQNPQISMF